MLASFEPSLLVVCLLLSHSSVGYKDSPESGAPIRPAIHLTLVSPFVLDFSLSSQLPDFIFQFGTQFCLVILLTFPSRFNYSY